MGGGTLTSNHPGPPAALAEPGGTLVKLSWNLTSNHPGPPRTRPSRSPCRTWWNPGGTLVKHPRLVEPYLKPPRTTPQPLQNLVEPWWNPGGTLVEPWWNPRGTLPQTTPDHPAALVEPGGTLVEPSWNWWNSGGTLVKPSWNLTSGPPRTTPVPIWAETPKLSAVGEKEKTNKEKHRVMLVSQCPQKDPRHVDVSDEARSKPGTDIGDACKIVHAGFECQGSLRHPKKDQTVIQGPLIQGKHRIER